MILNKGIFRSFFARVLMSFYRGRICRSPAISVSDVLDNPRNILIIPDLRAGGLFLGASKFKAIKNRYPRAEVSLLTEARREYIARQMPFIDDVILCSEFVLPIGTKLRELVRRLRRREFDLVFCFGDPDCLLPAYLCYRSGGKLRVGFHYDDVPFFNFRIVPGRDSCYEAERLSLMLQALNIAEGEGGLGWSVPQEGAKKILDRYLGDRRNPERLVGIDVSSGIGSPLTFRQWVNIVRAVDKACRAIIFFDFDQRHVANRLKEMLGPRALLFQTDDLPRTVALMEACEGFIAGNTDLFHLSVAKWLPTLGIVPKKDVPRWVPANRTCVKVVEQSTVDNMDGGSIVALLSEMREADLQSR